MYDAWYGWCIRRKKSLVWMQSTEGWWGCSDDMKKGRLCNPHTMLTWDSWNPPWDVGSDVVLKLLVFYHDTLEREQTRTRFPVLAGTRHRNGEKSKERFKVQERPFTCVTSCVESLWPVSSAAKELSRHLRIRICTAKMTSAGIYLETSKGFTQIPSCAG